MTLSHQLVAPRRLHFLCTLLEDGNVGILSSPSTSRPPVLVQLLRFADAPAEAIACSADGATPVPKVSRRRLTSVRHDAQVAHSLPQATNFRMT